MAENNPGEDKAWELIAARSPADICKAAAVSYDAASESYLVSSFGMDFTVSLKDRTISSLAPGSEVLLGRLGYFFKLSILWYLAGAKELACTGRLVKLQNIQGGEIFTRGSHVLPLDGIARKFGGNKEGFVEKGTSLGGRVETLGDAALRLSPLPRMPVVLALWVADEEFPARADLFFDSTCALQVPMDIVWSVAMMSVLVML